MQSKPSKDAIYQGPVLRRRRVSFMAVWQRVTLILMKSDISLYSGSTDKPAKYKIQLKDIMNLSLLGRTSSKILEISTSKSKKYQIKAADGEVSHIMSKILPLWKTATQCKILEQTTKKLPTEKIMKKQRDPQPPRRAMTVPARPNADCDYGSLPRIPPKQKEPEDYGSLPRSLTNDPKAYGVMPISRVEEPEDYDVLPSPKELKKRRPKKTKSHQGNGSLQRKKKQQYNYSSSDEDNYTEIPDMLNKDDNQPPSITVSGGKSNSMTIVRKAATKALNHRARSYSNSSDVSVDSDSENDYAQLPPLGGRMNLEKSYSVVRRGGKSVMQEEIFITS